MIMWGHRPGLSRLLPLMMGLSSEITCDRGASLLWVGLRPVNVREVSTLGRAPFWVEGVFV